MQTAKESLLSVHMESRVKKKGRSRQKNLFDLINFMEQEAR